MLACVNVISMVLTADNDTKTKEVTIKYTTNNNNFELACNSDDTNICLLPRFHGPKCDSVNEKWASDNCISNVKHCGFEYLTKIFCLYANLPDSVIFNQLTGEAYDELIKRENNSKKINVNYESIFEYKIGDYYNKDEINKPWYKKFLPNMKDKVVNGTRTISRNIDGYKYIALHIKGENQHEKLLNISYAVNNFDLNKKFYVEFFVNDNNENVYKVVVYFYEDGYAHSNKDMHHVCYRINLKDEKININFAPQHSNFIRQIGSIDIYKGKDKKFVKVQQEQKEFTFNAFYGESYVEVNNDVNLQESEIAKPSIDKSDSNKIKETTSEKIVEKSENKTTKIVVIIVLVVVLLGVITVGGFFTYKNWRKPAVKKENNEGLLLPFTSLTKKNEDAAESGRFTFEELKIEEDI